MSPAARSRAAIRRLLARRRRIFGLPGAQLLVEAVRHVGHFLDRGVVLLVLLARHLVLLFLRGVGTGRQLGVVFALEAAEVGVDVGVVLHYLLLRCEHFFLGGHV